MQLHRSSSRKPLLRRRFRHSPRDRRHRLRRFNRPSLQRLRSCRAEDREGRPFRAQAPRDRGNLLNRDRQLNPQRPHQAPLRRK